jgi:hypothetical protein
LNTSTVARTQNLQIIKLIYGSEGVKSTSLLLPASVGERDEVQFPAKAKHFSFLHSIQTNPISYPNGTEGSLPKGKAARA